MAKRQGGGCVHGRLCRCYSAGGIFQPAGLWCRNLLANRLRFVAPLGFGQIFHGVLALVIPPEYPHTWYDHPAPLAHVHGRTVLSWRTSLIFRGLVVLAGLWVPPEHNQDDIPEGFRYKKSGAIFYSSSSEQMEN